MNSKSVFFIGVLLVAVLVVGFMLGRLTYGGSTFVSDNNEKASSESGMDSEEDDTMMPSSSLTDGQKKMLSAAGIDPETFVVTAEMVACAEASLGTPRVLEIQNGATPSFAEGVKLAACYK